MQKPKKQEFVESYSKKLSSASVVILTDYKGLKVVDLNSLRKQLRTSKLEYKVVKNTLLEKTFEKANVKELSSLVDGPTGLAIGVDDPVAAIKILHNFSNEHEQLKIKGALIGGKILTAQEISAIAKLPPREIILAKVVGGIKAPITNFVFVLSLLLKKLVFVLKNIEEQKNKTEVS